MIYNTLTVEIDADGIALVSIDVPDQSMNVITATLVEDLTTFVDNFTSNDSIKGAVITSGKANGFVAGADIRMLQTMGGELSAEEFAAANGFSRILRKMETGGLDAKAIAKEGKKAKPVACALEGLALGGGLEIALACHYRVVADSPKVKLGLPEVQIGVLPGAGGTQRTPRLIGIQNAVMMTTQGNAITPQQALDQGLIHATVEPGKALEAARAWVKGNPAVLQPWDQKGFKIPGGSGTFNPAIAQLFSGACAMSLAKTKNNFPAVKAILSCLYEGTILPMDKALETEVKYFMTLLADPVAKNMIRSLFVNKQALEKGAARPKGIAPLDIKTVGVLGAGLMGAGIVHVSIQGGMDVVVLDRTAEEAAKAVAYNKKILDKRVARGKMSQEKADAFLARIKPTTDYADLADVDLVIEAVFEQPDIKADVIKKAEAHIRPEVTFATNTSTIPIGSLAENSSRPDQFIGLHFFSPVERMPLLEIIPHAKTGDAALAAAFDYNRKIRKVPIVVKDTRGFYANQVFVPYVAEATRMITEGVNPALIENCAAHLGMPANPLAIMDDTSLTLGYDVIKTSQEQMGDAYEPNGTEEFYELMVEKLDRLGRRAGKGVYDYGPKGERLGLWAGLANHYPHAENQPSAAEVTERLLYAQLIPTARCYADGVVSDPQSADVGAIFAWGFPSWTGGPLSHIDTMGLDNFVANADRLTTECGPRFEVPSLFRDMASKGQSLYSETA
ncbi:MAG: 3-hydroxyacyl-CoA dehydrogenase NAD-binding domain-containing protein [Sphingorhabdus sp.]